MRIAVAGTRLLLAALIVTAVVATHLDVASRTAVNPFNLYGYFTIQSNLIGAAALVVLAVIGLRGGRPGPAATLLRAVATTCIVIVGLVYALLLAPLGAAGGVQVEWANFILHVVSPIAFAAGWLLLGDRRRIRFPQLWVLLVYPAVWTTVVLIRGATDGWVPYPFLDPAQGEPAQGYGGVAVYCVGILLVFVVVGLLVIWASRLPGLLRR